MAEFLTEIGEQIRKTRKLRRLSQEDLALAVGTTQVTISRIENDQLKGIKKDLLYEIVRYLNIPYEQILGRVSESVKEVPIVGEIPPGPSSDPPFQAGDSIGTIHVYGLQYKEVFALRVRDNSMEPEFTEGDIIVVAQMQTVKNGSLTLVRSGGKWMIMRVHTRDGMNLPFYLPLNFRDKIYESSELELIGKVVQKEKTFV